MPNLPTYVLITPARNEALFIEKTIISVAAQTFRPIKWVIVSDGSTDATDDIVRKYAKDYNWIELVRTPEHSERHFAAKVHAFNAGYVRVKDLGYEIIGNLDADVSFDEKDYFAFLVSKFAEDRRLGVGGTPYRHENSRCDSRFINVEDVVGACQLFRRECFEEIGGYEQSSPEICHAGKSFLPARLARSGAEPYLEGIRIGPCRTRRQRERDVLHLRGIAANLPARGASDGGSPLNH